MNPFQDGIVQLGLVSANASWRVEQAGIEMRFDADSLPDDATRHLEHYRHSSKPLAVKLPAMPIAIPGIVIGFDRHPRFVTFHIATSDESVNSPRRLAKPVQRRPSPGTRARRRD